MSVISAEIGRHGETIAPAGVEKPVAPREYTELGLLPKVVGAELADLERHPIQYRPGEREQMTQFLREAGMQVPMSPLMGTNRITVLLRDPNVFMLLTGAMLWIANK